MPCSSSLLSRSSPVRTASHQRRGVEQARRPRPLAGRSAGLHPTHQRLQRFRL
jgi:hypothetical protein